MDVRRIYEIIDSFPPIKERVPKFKRPKKMNPEESYSWLINDWMPSQPDFDKIAELTIGLNFNVVLVVAALMGRERFGKQVSEFGHKPSDSSK